MATAKKCEFDVFDMLIEALGVVNRPGKVCEEGDRPLTMPGLEVDNPPNLSHIVELEGKISRARESI